MRLIISKLHSENVFARLTFALAPGHDTRTEQRGHRTLTDTLNEIPTGIKQGNKVKAKDPLLPVHGIYSHSCPFVPHTPSLQLWCHHILHLFHLCAVSRLARQTAFVHNRDTVSWALALLPPTYLPSHTPTLYNSDALLQSLLPTDFDCDVWMNDLAKEISYQLLKCFTLKLDSSLLLVLDRRTSGG